MSDPDQTGDEPRSHAPRGPLGREELETLVGADMSIAEIAKAVDRCKTTVRYWLARYGLRTRGKRRRAETAEGGGLEGAVILSTCKRHGTTGRTIALDALRVEARKCLLLCSNCHAEVEGGVARVPLQFVDDREGADAVGSAVQFRSSPIHHNPG